MDRLFRTTLTKKENFVASQRWHEFFLGPNRSGFRGESTPESLRWNLLLSTPGTLVAARAKLAYERASSKPTHLWRTAEEAYACLNIPKPDAQDLADLVVSEGLDAICLADLDPVDGFVWTLFVTHEEATRFVFKQVELDCSSGD